MSPEAPIGRLCAEVLSTGSRCKQFALRGQHFCYAHADPMQRERNADARQLVAMIERAELFSVAVILANTVEELRAKTIPPLHAQAIFDAAAARLEQLQEQEQVQEQIPAQATSARFQPPAADPGKSNLNNGLHVVPMK